jgi:hypothetical protein
MQVYVVDSYDMDGEGSHVEGVFSSLGKAEEYVRGMYLESPDEYAITETELDKGYFFVAGMGWRGKYLMRKAVT